MTPLLPPLDLPLENYYVLKIQATYALIDWLAQIVGSIAAYPSVHDVLAGSPTARNDQGERLRSQIITHLHGLLDNPSRRQTLCAYLADALQLDQPANDLANSLLWGEPRPLILQVIPTLLRQLESNWRVVWKTTAGVLTYGTTILPNVPCRILCPLRSLLT